MHPARGGVRGAEPAADAPRAGVRQGVAEHAQDDLVGERAGVWG